MMLFDSKEIYLYLSFIKFLLLYSTITTFYNRIYSNHTIIKDNRKTHARIYYYEKIYYYISNEND